MLKNHGLHIASSVCFDFKEAQVSGDSFLGVCMDTSDQITSICQWHSRVGHAAGRAPGQRLVFPVAVASESSMPGSDWTVELRAGTCIWSLFWWTSIALSDVQSVGRRKNPVSHTKEMNPGQRQKGKRVFVPGRGKDWWVPVGTGSWQSAWIGSMGWDTGLGLT